MDYNDDARLDTSQVEDTRAGGGGGGISSGGFGGAGIVGLLLPLLFSGRRGRFGWPIVIVGVVAYFVFAHFTGGGTSTTNFGQIGSGGHAASADNSELAKECKTGKDADQHLECAVVADINSIQGYWSAAYPSLARQQRGATGVYSEVDTVFFRGQVSTACGSADSGAGPFYCPGDHLVYLDLSFYDDLRQRFGAQTGPLVDAYVLAHEYGHHVQDLLGTESSVRTRQGASSDSVRLELQADCYAGVWMDRATRATDGKPALVENITPADLRTAVDAAGRIGDDYIQHNLGGGSVDPGSFTHGTSAQREKWLTTGFRTGDAARCDTFATNELG